MSAAFRKLEFVECATCSAKPGSPTLCPGCLHNRDLIQRLQGEQKSPRPVGAAAAGSNCAEPRHQRVPFGILPRAQILRAGGLFISGLVKWAAAALVAGAFLVIGIHAGRVITLAACSSVFHVGAFGDE